MSTVFAPMRYKLSVDDFQKLYSVGVLTDASLVELIEGELIETAPSGARHAEVLSLLYELLTSQTRGLTAVLPQCQVRLPPRSVPTADLLLLRGGANSVASGAPLAEHVLLAVEISGNTLEHDRDVKLPLYAQHGIAEAWIVHLNGRALEIYREPGPKGYQRKLEPALTDVVSPRGLPHVAVPVGDLFR